MIEVENSVEVKNQESSLFKLKIIKEGSPYPTPFTETDFLKFKVGDFLNKGRDSILYRIEHIARVTVDQKTIDDWEERSNTCSYVDTKIKDLLQEYSKNGNFGPCELSIRCILRGSKPVAKGRLIRLLEFEQIYNLGYYRCYTRAELSNIIVNKDYSAKRWERYSQRYLDRATSDRATKQAVQDIMNKYNKDQAA